MKALLWVLVPILMLFYPVLVYFGLQHFGPALLAAVLCLAVVVRILIMGKAIDLKSWFVLVSVVLYCATVALLDSETLLRYYPVLMSCAVAGLFWASLFDEEPILERAARLSGKFITPKAKVYLRKLTVIWVVTILANAVIAGYTACCASMDVWGIYNGAISYGVFALLFIGEWIYRQYYIRRYDSD